MQGNVSFLLNRRIKKIFNITISPKDAFINSFKCLEICQSEGRKVLKICTSTSALVETCKFVSQVFLWQCSNGVYVGYSPK